jgi:hypothetical protein
MMDRTKPRKVVGVRGGEREGLEWRDNYVIEDREESIDDEVCWR